MCIRAPKREMRSILLFIFLTTLPGLAAAVCMEVSREHRVPVIELYTSEGCDSCPPADRWVSELPTRGLGPDRIVVLGFHVDYWDKLGWRDPFAQRVFSDRQRAVNARNGARFVYTPQLLLEGKDYRAGFGRDDIVDRIVAMNTRKPGATIMLRLEPPAGRYLKRPRAPSPSSNLPDRRRLTWLCTRTGCPARSQRAKTAASA